MSDVLYLGAYEDSPFVKTADLKAGKVTETDYYAESPFICISEIGKALLDAIDKSRFTINQSIITFDKKDPMNVYKAVLDLGTVKVTLGSMQYLRPSRAKRPPRSENKAQFPWGYLMSLRFDGDDEAKFQLLSEFLIVLGREPWEGLEFDELEAANSISENDILNSWLEEIRPVLDLYKDKARSAAELKIDTKEVEILLEDAEGALENKKLTYFIHLLKKMDFSTIDAKLEEERKQGKELTQAIIEITGFIKEGKAMGLDTLTAEHYLKSAKKAMAEKKWKVSAEHIRKARGIVDSLKEASRPFLTMKMEYPQKALVGDWNKLYLILKNDGNVPASGITIKVDGDITTQKIHPPLRLEKDQTDKVTVNISTPTGGPKKISIKVDYVREYDETTYDFIQDLELSFVDPSLKLDVKSAIDTTFGYLKVDLKIINNYVSEVRDLALEMKVDENQMQMDYVNPRFDIKGGKILVDRIERDSILSISLFYDTFASADMFISGGISFSDPKGEPKYLLFNVEPIYALKVKAVMGEVPSSKMLIERLGTTHTLIFDRVYQIPISLRPTTCYDIFRRTLLTMNASMIWENGMFIAADTSSPEHHLASKIDEGVDESWFTIQDREPGFSAGVHLRANATLDTIELYIAGNSPEYSYPLLLTFQEAFQEQLRELGYIGKEENLHQIRNLWLRQRVKEKPTELFAMLKLENKSLMEKIEDVARKRADSFEKMKNMERKAFKYKSWSGQT